MATHKAHLANSLWPDGTSTCDFCGDPAQPSKAYPGQDTCENCENFEVDSLDPDEPEEFWKPTNSSYGEDEAYDKPYDMNDLDDDIPMSRIARTRKALADFQEVTLPALKGDPSVTLAEEELDLMGNRADFALDNYPEEEGLDTSNLENLNQQIELEEPVEPSLLIGAGNDIGQVYTASVKYLQASFPTPEHMKAAPKGKTAMKQEDFVMDAPKLLGKPGSDWDSTNYFDNRDLSRKFYSQFYEGAVLIADDGSYYQILQLVVVSGNFVCMLQDILYPQIVFTLGVTDLMAHIWKWITPYDVVVNPELAPGATQSVSDIISVDSIEKPAVPDRWLSY